MDFTFISSVLIYAAMFIFMYACINPHGFGLIRLHRLSRDLKNAASLLNEEKYCSKLKDEIRTSNVNAADDLFYTKVLSEQMQQYCDSIHKIETTSSGNCRADIDEYINYDLLHQQGRVAMCEHTASGFTALGILGTFLGMAFGLTSLSQDNSQQIITGISGLLDGMNLAFLTSIFGIILSLALGTALRLVLGEAESNLELFLTRFRNNVMRNQSEAALNEIIIQINRIQSHMNTANELQSTTMGRTVTAFVAEFRKAMEIDTGFLQAAIQDMSKQQQAHSKSIQNLTAQMGTMANSLQNVSRSFQPVLEHNQELSEQIDRASRTLKSSVEDIHSLLTADADALSKHQQIIAELQRTSEYMKNLLAVIQQQSAETAEHYQSVTNDHQAAMSTCLNRFAQTSNAFVDDLTARSTMNMDALQQHANELLRHMPQGGISAAKLDRLLQQNETIIDQQAQMIRIMEKTVPILKRPWIRRPKK